MFVIGYRPCLTGKRKIIDSKIVSISNHAQVTLIVFSRG